MLQLFAVLVVVLVVQFNVLVVAAVANTSAAAIDVRMIAKHQIDFQTMRLRCDIRRSVRRRRSDRQRCRRRRRRRIGRRMPNDCQSVGAGQVLVELRFAAKCGGTVVEIAAVLLQWLFGFRGAFSAHGFGGAVLVGAARLFRTRRCAGRCGCGVVVVVARLLAAMVVGMGVNEMLGELRLERETFVAADDGAADVTAVEEDAVES